jgi:hypothetical protein
MVSLSTNPFFTLTAQKTSPSTRFQPKNNNANPFYNNKHSKDHRKVICACIAPPRNFNTQDSSAIQFNVKSFFLFAFPLFVFPFLFDFLMWGLELTQFGFMGVIKFCSFFVLWVSSSFVVFDHQVCICYFLGFIQIRTIKHSEGS